MSEDDTRGADADPAAEPVGSVADEAAKLFGVLSGWARDHGSDLGQQVSDLAGTAAHAAAEVDEHLATGDPECRYCPVCRTVHLVRQASPEVREHLSAAASSLLQAAAGALATAVPPESSGRPGQAGEPGPSERARRSREQRRARGGGVERIDIDLDADPDADPDDEPEPTGG